MPSREELVQLQSLPLEIKIMKTQQRIREWVEYYGIEGVYVSFSGGKDSTVLLHIARQLYPNIKAVFVDTGLEYPEIRQFVKTFDNVEILRPKMRFDEVIKKYGYPFISKEVGECIYSIRKSGATDKYKSTRLARLKGEYKDKDGNKSMFNLEKWYPLLNLDFIIGNKCCRIMKKNPAHKYQKETKTKTITGQTAEESRLRQQMWLNNGCNGFNMKQPISNPMSFWREQDILQYIYKQLKDSKCLW